MRLRARDYREQLYRMRSHPRSDEWSFHDQRDSFAMVYLSVIPFGVAEYVVELNYEVLPGALIFPIGFLLFWAFYYTYYKPGFLENRLTAPTQDLTAVPVLLLGVLIWFVKVTFVELSHLVLLQWWAGAKPQASVRAKPAPAGAHKAPPRPAAAPKAPPSLLPPDAMDALLVLGLKPGCSWRDIHRQYRALAKQFHPDLNPDITDFGRRFMKVDTAYHRLEKLRSKHFPD